VIPSGELYVLFVALCSSCETANDPDVSYCRECGVRLY
jgi:ribosomal protein L40E